MVIDENYEEIKDKYFSQAQTKTGVISSVVKVLNDFVKAYDSAKKVMTDENDRIKKTYVFNSAEYNQKEMEVYNTFNETVATIRAEYNQKVLDSVQAVKDKVSEIISAKMPEDAMNDVVMIQNFAGKLSDDEIRVFLNKYSKCYFVTKVIFGAMAEGQEDSLGVKFVSADDILGTIDSIKGTALDMIRNYNGAVTYNVAVMLNGDNIQAVNDSFESFVSAYKG